MTVRLVRRMTRKLILRMMLRITKRRKLRMTLRKKLRMTSRVMRMKLRETEADRSEEPIDPSLADETIAGCMTLR
jgi:hypothetical protein